jgi:hypothetical protein
MRACARLPLARLLGGPRGAGEHGTLGRGRDHARGWGARRAGPRAWGSWAHRWATQKGVKRGGPRSRDGPPGCRGRARLGRAMALGREQAEGREGERRRSGHRAGCVGEGARVGFSLFLSYFLYF